MNRQIISEVTLHTEGFPALEGQIPCSLYSILLDNELIPDPYYRDNEKVVMPLSRQDADFTAVVTIGEEEFSSEHLILHSNGIDTFADIYLNEILVGRCNNMHRLWEFDIKSAAKPGENKLRVHFASPSVMGEKLLSEHYLYGSGNSLPGIALMRKSYCMFGWDWAPQLPDMGFYRSLEILSWNGARIEDLYVRQIHEDGKVKVLADLTLSEETNRKAVCELITPEGKVIKADFVDGKAEFLIEDPELWWPNGLGKQPLYKVRALLLENDEAVDSREVRIGLRTLTVSRKKDEVGNGEEFAFVCNGVKFFSMGGDYVPEDSILARTNPGRTEKLLQNCLKANFNTVRVWGGGFYPNDYFYDLCDEYGFVIWQDFMFACSHVWMSEEFTENVRMEAIDVLKRIRNHPSLGLLCGNNEMESCMVECWDGKPQNPILMADYLKLYENLLPKICGEYAPAIFYWPASASSGGHFDDPNAANRGDTHYWEVWLKGKSLENYRYYKFRYLSEFGFESFPNIKTVYAYTDPSDRNPYSYVMDWHQKCCKGAGNQWIMRYLSEKYLLPESFEATVYAAQIQQADAIRYGVEHYRRFRGTCMGAVYWQLNDCWPVASWSSIDYYGRWKALHHAARRFFAPVLLSAHDEGTKVTFNVQNETMNPFKGKLKVSVKKTDFTVISEETCDVSLDKLSTLDVLTKDFADIVGAHERDYFLSFVLYDEDGKRVSGSTLLFTMPKYFLFPDPQIKVGISGGNGKFLLKVKADAYARFVDIDFSEADLLLDDNFFDIDAGDEITLTAETDDLNVTAEELRKQLTILSVRSLAKY